MHLPFKRSVVPVSRTELLTYLLFVDGRADYQLAGQCFHLTLIMPGEHSSNVDQMSIFRLSVDQLLMFW